MFKHTHTNIHIQTHTLTHTLTHTYKHLDKQAPTYIIIMINLCSYTTQGIYCYACIYMHELKDEEVERFCSVVEMTEN